MKKVIFVFLIFLIAGYFGVTALKSSAKIPLVSSNPSPQVLGVSHEPSANPAVSLPRQLIIPSLKIDAPIEQVGMDSLGRMDVPQNSSDAAWYKLGFKVGEKGSAVIDGHFDRKDGSPAIFYNLDKINIGDIIKVRNEDGKEFNFKVTKKQLYDFDKVPLQEVFNSTDKSRLNLITCDGVFDKNAKNYSKRLVVYAENLTY